MERFTMYCYESRKYICSVVQDYLKGLFQFS